MFQLNFTKSLFLPFLGISFFIFFQNCEVDSSVRFITTPCKMGGEPNLHITNSGKALLSWVEYLNDSTDVLTFAHLDGYQWSAPEIITSGNNWFVNWADFPSLVTYQEDEAKMAAHWLQKSAPGTYDYDVRISQSVNGGKDWSPAFIPHKDGIAAEHGFVSLLPTGNNQIFASWLDGRYTKTENVSDGHDHEGQRGAMTLRGAFFDDKGQLFNGYELDGRVCDCCSTSAALTSKGVIVAYRDRSEEEIRDISIVRQMDTDWTQPRTVFADNWEIAGCPVNGPKIIANGEEVALAWFTMAGDTARVKFAVSSDAGANFSLPVQIDEGRPLGRVGLEFDDSGWIVSWLESINEEEALIRLAKINRQLKIEKRQTVSSVSSSRSTGFPVVKRYGEDILVAWTTVLDEEENTSIQTALLRF